MEASSPSPSIVACLISFILFYLLSIIRWRARSRGLPLPPGPRAIPFIGNIALMSQPDILSVYRGLCETFGDIVYIHALGKRLVILGSPQSINDVLDKQSAVTSDRQQTSLIELTGQDCNVGFMPYSHWWRLHRRAFSRSFPTTVPADHLVSQRRSALMLTRKLLENPTELCEHIRYTVAGSIVQIAYGIKVEERHDRDIALIEKALEGVEAFSPGRFLVQHLPGVRHLPEWLPFVGWQLRQLAASRAAAREAKDGMFNKTKEALERGESSTSVLASLLKQSDQSKRDVLEQRAVAKNVAITAFIAGAETTFSALQFFFLALSLNPDVQKKARAELDVVVGPDRLPDWTDMGSLPYVDAIVKETLRWENVAPFSIPHHSMEDIEYNGYFIPKGTVLVPLIWACMHDPEAYPEPERFWPDRFLRDGRFNPDVRDPADFVFGYGRRVCPGKAYAEAGLCINVATVLHLFEITPPLDEAGNTIHIEPRLKGELSFHPEDCRCTIKPRSERARELIMSTYMDMSEGPSSG